MVSAVRFFGGVATGLGEGLLAKAKADREATLARLRQEGADRRQEDQQKHSEGLIRSTITDEGGNVYGVTGAGTKDLGIKDYKALIDGLGLNPKDKALIDTVTKAETKDEGSYKGKVVNREAIAQRLIERGRPDLAKLVGPLESGQAGPKVDSPEYREAQRQAEAWADDEAGYLSTDKTDFAKYGGNRAEAVRKKTLEILAEGTGGGGKSVTQGAPQSSGQYKTPEDVRDAYRSGTLTRDEAGKILREQFELE